MARMAFKGLKEYELRLSKLGAGTEAIAKKAVYAGTEIIADEINSKLEALPTDTFRYLRGDDKFIGLPQKQKDDLIASFGVTPIDERNGIYSSKVGFDGYGSIPTQKYPQGIPNQLLARAVESGSSVRQKTPFVRPAVNASKKKAEQAMAETIDKEIDKLMK